MRDAPGALGGGGLMLGHDAATLAAARVYVIGRHSSAEVRQKCRMFFAGKTGADRFACMGSPRDSNEKAREALTPPGLPASMVGGLLFGSEAASLPDEFPHTRQPDTLR